MCLVCSGKFIIIIIVIITSIIVILIIMAFLYLRFRKTLYRFIILHCPLVDKTENIFDGLQ